MSIDPMYTVQGSPSRAHAAALATPCLSRAGLGNDAPGAEPLREQRLADRVVDLVRTGMRQILALEPQLRAPVRDKRPANVSAVGRPTQLVSCSENCA